MAPKRGAVRPTKTRSSRRIRNQAPEYTLGNPEDILRDNRRQARERRAAAIAAAAPPPVAPAAAAPAPIVPAAVVPAPIVPAAVVPAAVVPAAVVPAAVVPAAVVPAAVVPAAVDPAPAAEGPARTGTKHGTKYEKHTRDPEGNHDAPDPKKRKGSKGKEPAADEPPTDKAPAAEAAIPDEPCKALRSSLARFMAEATAAGATGIEDQIVVEQWTLLSTAERAISAVTEAISERGLVTFALVDGSDTLGERSTLRAGQEVLFPTHRGPKGEGTHLGLFIVRNDATAVGVVRVENYDSLPAWRALRPPAPPGKLDHFTRKSYKDFRKHLSLRFWSGPDGTDRLPAYWTTPADQVNQQSNWCCGLLTILNAWIYALGLPRLPGDLALNNTRNYWNDTRDIINLAMRGLMDSATIRNFLACYRFVPHDAVVPEDRRFNRTIAFNSESAISRRIQWVILQEELRRRREDDDLARLLPPTVEELLRGQDLETVDLRVCNLEALVGDWMVLTTPPAKAPPGGAPPGEGSDSDDSGIRIAKKLSFDTLAADTRGRGAEAPGKGEGHDDTDSAAGSSRRSSSSGGLSDHGPPGGDEPPPPPPPPPPAAGTGAPPTGDSGGRGGAKKHGDPRRAAKPPGSPRGGGKAPYVMRSVSCSSDPHPEKVANFSPLTPKPGSAKNAAKMKDWPTGPANIDTMKAKLLHKSRFSTGHGLHDFMSPWRAGEDDLFGDDVRAAAASNPQTGPPSPFVGQYEGLRTPAGLRAPSSSAIGHQRAPESTIRQPSALDALRAVSKLPSVEMIAALGPATLDKMIKSLDARMPLDPTRARVLTSFIEARALVPAEGAKRPGDGSVSMLDRGRDLGV